MGDFDLKPIMTPARKRREKRAKEKRPCVYFMENRETGAVKIGRSGFRAVRIKDVALSSGTEEGERAYFGYFEVDEDKATALENALHKKFAAFRSTGEWFVNLPLGWKGDAFSVAQSICGENFRVAGMIDDVVGHHALAGVNLARMPAAKYKAGRNKAFC